MKRRGGGWTFPTGLVPYDPQSYASSIPDPQAVLRAASVKEASALLSPKPATPAHTLRSVAQSALQGIIGTHAGVYFLGNAPITVQRVRDPKASSSKKPAASPSSTEAPVVLGSKTFFMHALYMDGEVRMQNTKEFDDYAWIKKTDLPKYVGEEQAKILDVVLLEPEM